MKTMVTEKLYEFKNKTAAVASRAIDKINVWTANGSPHLVNAVQNVKTVYEFLECVAEAPTAMMNLRDILGEFGVIADLLEAHLEGSEIGKVINSFEEPMAQMFDYVEQIRDVVGVLLNVAEQAGDFGKIKETLLKALWGAFAGIQCK